MSIFGKIPGRLRPAMLGALLLSLSACQAVDNLLIGVGGLQPSVSPSDSPPAEALRFPAEHPVPFKAAAQTLQVRRGESYQPLFLKGINLGVGLPGTQAGDLAASREQYAAWFARMAELGFNNLRVYTLHYPRFYEELARYNAAHPDKPLYLFHGAWLDEEEGAHDLYDETRQFDTSIKEVVDAIHGNLTLTTRAGRAYGTYTADVSRWVMGWIIGREVHPEEVLYTNERHASDTRYEGQNVALSGSPSETWFAERLDGMIQYEREKYGVDRPIAVSSWPTLDPLDHPTENPLESSEDIASIDMRKLEVKNLPAGFFASYHAYPYYPNFMIHEPRYQSFKDTQGVNNYLGYLQDLKAHYGEIPLVIGEYGTSSSWGNAHFSPNGIHHGGLDERAQMAAMARMTQNIHDTGLAGGMVFAWIDEWWKRTWIVDELTFPRERYRLWHNLTSPEENFGLIAFDIDNPHYQTLQRGTGRVQHIETAADAAYFYLRLQLQAPLAAHEKLTLGIDTYRDDLGERLLPGGIQTARRNEFALEIASDKPMAQLRVTQPYDLLGIWHNASGPEQLFQSRPTQGAPWLPVRWKNGQEHTSRDGQLRFPLTIHNIGELKVREGNAPKSSHDAVMLEGHQITVRLPWVLLNVVDPSTHSVMHDDRSTRGRESATSEGFGVSVALGSELLESQQRYRWPAWDSPPPTRQREKAGIEVLSDTLKRLPG